MQKARKLFFPQLESAKLDQQLESAAENTKKQKLRKKSIFLTKNVSGMPHSAENSRESSMLAKLLVSSEN